MSSKYVPPALRNKNRNQFDQSPKQKLPTSDDFPSLAGNAVNKSKTSFQSPRSFAALATEWNEHAEEERIQKEVRDSIEQRESQRRLAEQRNVFVYHQNNDYNNSYSDELYDESSSQSKQKDDWTVIQKKARQELTPEELFDKKMRQEEEEKRLADESVWKDSTGDDWDYRDRRAYS